MSFCLRKWYFDVVTPGGDAAIGYWADLAFGPVRLHYSALLLAAREGRVQNTSSLATDAAPERTRDGASWKCASLGLEIAATGNFAASPPLDLYRDDEGSVRWSPMCPDAEVRLTSPGGTFAGRGYVEEINLTIPPWKLPISRLHWGRWIGARSCRAWLRWEGPHPLQLLLPETQRGPGEISVETGRVLGPGTDLRLGPPRTLRDGPIGTSLLAGIPGLRSWAPAAMLGAVETKWLSRGRLHDGDAVADEGWAIHELVQFRGAS